MKINIPIVTGFLIILFGAILILKFPFYFGEGLIFYKPNIFYFVPAFLGMSLFIYGIFKKEQVEN